jgi:hypothetical protein
MRLMWVGIALSAFATGATCKEPDMPASIQVVKAKHQHELMARPGVVSVGIGKDADGNPVIIVGLDRERPETVQALPRELEGYPVRAEVIGRIRSQ